MPLFHSGKDGWVTWKPRSRRGKADPDTEAHAAGDETWHVTKKTLAAHAKDPRLLGLALAAIAGGFAFSFPGNP